MRIETLYIQTNRANAGWRILLFTNIYANEKTPAATHCYSYGVSVCRKFYRSSSHVPFKLHRLVIFHFKCFSHPYVGYRISLLAMACRNSLTNNKNIATFRACNTGLELIMVDLRSYSLMVTLNIFKYLVLARKCYLHF